MHVVFINTVVWKKFNIITTKLKCTKYFYQSINREGELCGKLLSIYMIVHCGWLGCSLSCVAIPFSPALIIELPFIVS